MVARTRHSKDNDTKLLAAPIEDINKALGVKTEQILEEVKANLPLETSYNAH